MKLMLIQLPHFFEGMNRPPLDYPLGIGYLVNTLKDTHELVPLDLWTESASVDKAMHLIRANVPDIFGISVYSTQYPYFKEFANRLKKEYPDKKIIAGGPGATFSHRIFLEKTPVDVCVIGEGELTLRELLENLDHPENVKGVAFRKVGKVVKTEDREQIRDLDSLPLPDRHFFQIERYIEAMISNRGLEKGIRATNIIAGRGCPYLCTFCSKTFHGSRIRSIASIASEIETIKRDFNVKGVVFNDELVILNKKRTLELCRAMKAAGVKWGCQGRINVVDEEILRAMKDSGCVYIGYGIEAYSQDILDRMKKNIKIDQIVPVIELTKKIGIMPIIQYMYGFPGENDASIRSTVEFFDKIDHPYIGFTTTPLPGTEIYAEAMKKGLIGDEEEFLTKLTSGYNSFEPLANMTEFSNRDFVLKKMELQKEVDRNYYGKHPVKRIERAVLRFLFLTRMMLLHPVQFLKKVVTHFTR